MAKVILNNIELARKARSVQDLVRITSNIAKTIATCSSVVNKLTKTSPKLRISLATTRPSRISVALSARDTSTEEIAIRHTGVPTRTTKPTKSTAIPGMVGKDFRPANLKAAEPHVAVIDELHDKLQELDSIEALLIQAFPDAKGQAAALKAVRALKQELDITYDKAFNAITKIGEANLPIELRKLGEDAQDFLDENLEKGSFKEGSIDNYQYVSKTKDGSWCYTYYITIDDLKNASGFTFNTYYVVVTAIIDKTKHVNYYLTTLADFRVPGKFPTGSPIKDIKDLKLKLNVMLRHNDVINMLGKKPLPLDTKSSKTRGFTNIPGVADTSVVDDTLVVKLTAKKPLPQDIANIVKSVMLLLRPLMGTKAKNSDIIWKKVPKRGSIELQFSLVTAVGSVNKSGINVDKLKDLQHALDLGDDEVDAIKSALTSVRK